jgi:hypothetical protein
MAVLAAVGSSKVTVALLVAPAGVMSMDETLPLVPVSERLQVAEPGRHG